MDINKQVCDPKLAAELRRLGVKQDSLYFWQTNEDGGCELKQTGFTGQGIRQYEAFSAFTVAELGEMLRICGEGASIPQPKYGSWEHDTEADDRAATVIQLIKR